MNTEKLPQDLAIRIKIISEFGFKINSNTVILDFGCGSGKKVQNLRDAGFEAYGCGTRFNAEDGIDTDLLINQGVLRRIDMSNYILPFENNTFDFIFSESVFEHVRNYPETISEISRVIKPDGICLHTFVSRCKLVEVHVTVPFASVIQNYFWMYFWILLGRKNEWQDCKTAKDRALRYINYLETETNYLTKRQLLTQFGTKFKEVKFCENLLLKYSSGKRRYLHSLSKALPFIPDLFSTFQSRVIMTRKPDK